MKKLFTLLLVLICTSVMAKEIEVPKDYGTIQKAIDNSSDGDIIKLGYGHFYEYLNIDKSVTIKGIGNTYIHCPDQGKSPFRNPNALINVADNEVTFDLVQLYGKDKNDQYNPNMLYGIDALNSMITVKRCSIFGLQKCSIKAKGGTLEVSSLGVASRTLDDKRVPYGFILDDVGAASFTTLSCNRGNTETLFLINDSYTGSRKTIVSVKKSKLGDVKIDAGRKESYQIVLDEGTQFYYDYTQKDLDVEGVEYTYETSINPVLHYRFDGDLKDNSSSQNDGVATGAPKYVADIWGQPNMALRFDSDNQMDVLELEKFNKKEFTCSFWYSNALEEGKKGGVVRAFFPGKQNATFTVHQSYLKDKDSIKLSFYVLQKDGESKKFEADKTTWGFVILDKKWHHITLSAKVSEEVKIYVDGALRVTKELDDELLIRTPIQLQVGSTDASGSTNTLGCYDDLRMYNRQLADREVADLARMDDEDMEENPDEGLEDLAPPPPFMDKGTDQTKVPSSKEDKSSSGTTKTITFDVEKGLFTNRFDGNNYSFSLPANLQYNSHNEVVDNLLVSYTDTKNGENYLGIWNKSLQYQAEYNFKNIKVISYDLYFTESNDKYVLIHYDDPGHNSQFIGIFKGSNMQYVGQYEVTGKHDVKIVSSNSNPTVSYKNGDQKKNVEFGLVGNFIKEYETKK